MPGSPSQPRGGRPPPTPSLGRGPKSEAATLQRPPSPRVAVPAVLAELASSAGSRGAAELSLAGGRVYAPRAPRSAACVDGPEPPRLIRASLEAELAGPEDGPRGPTWASTRAGAARCAGETPHLPLARPPASTRGDKATGRRDRAGAPVPSRAAGAVAVSARAAGARPGLGRPAPARAGTATALRLQAPPGPALGCWRRPGFCTNDLLRIVSVSGGLG
ncbi:translation initiation factor IF-2-like [Vulpes lagopus]|uniref:translation initiation factor IF-2-like n=1 Tax=Vulpes lagopus TaxID=494514 RepID=UPI001BCA0F1D|nr:translation initiation factor IF-2-like [Vulpes lagopus]